MEIVTEKKLSGKKAWYKATSGSQVHKIHMYVYVTGKDEGRARKMWSHSLQEAFHLFHNHFLHLLNSSTTPYSAPCIKSAPTVWSSLPKP